MNKILPILTVSLLFGACSNEPEPGEKKMAKQETTTTGEESLTDDFMLPQPITLATAFKEAGLTYKAAKTNPAASKDRYALKIDQLLNLGVYSTDLAYCAINNKSQEARDYMAAVQSLGDKVGLSSVFSDKALIEKFDKSLGDQTLMENMIIDLQEKSERYMHDNDLRHLAAIQFAGAWIEGMYLGIEDARTKKSLGTALTDQMVLLENTIKGLQNQPSQDARLKEVLGKFTDILATYDAFASVKKSARNANMPPPELSAEEFDQLTGKITALRTNIVSPSN